MDPVDLLTIADEVCQAHGAQIRSLPALVAVSAATTPHIDGIPVPVTPADIEDIVLRLEPLTSDNTMLAGVIITMLR